MRAIDHALELRDFVLQMRAKVGSDDDKKQWLTLGQKRWGRRRIRQCQGGGRASSSRGGGRERRISSCADIVAVPVLGFGHGLVDRMWDNRHD